ncbi:IS1634 family transposase [Rickettsiales endosymbiont of Peranema trichophorum]|uniref:IS1634 family transposase n=1 Tax=Rickettsiales endosymbiont of Peranema trichophorum TaxID=2486577 RepID=UPI001023B141|nr:IS1634 family transposase [Rickettsiales endosymbiont of Peranema trichophorum]RZI47384.1 IS1634 family transposase [Rickettsiales endosymbiont of Peranema trichophorum]
MEGQPLITNHDITEIRRENWGLEVIIDRLFSIYKLEPLFAKLTLDRKIEYDIVAAVKFMVATRFVEQMSKLASFHQRHSFSGFGNFDLQHLYRSLDELHRYQTEIKTHLFRSQKALSKKEIDVVFFDVTTLYFESQQSDRLRDFGFSKDCKFNETQIVLSLLITSDGRPIGYEIFPGNQYEGNTLLDCLQQLRDFYNVQKVVIVADRGLSSFQNL